MKPTLRVAYGGVLTGVSVALLLAASASPWSGWAFCISAGMLPAIPLAHRQVRLGLMVFAATGVLSVLIVPSKRFVTAYVLFFGLYPLVKYGIEQLRCLPLEWACKLAFAALAAGLVLWLVQLGFFPLGGRALRLPRWLLIAAALFAFAGYDIIFSRIIALFRIFFRDR